MVSTPSAISEMQRAAPPMPLARNPTVRTCEESAIMSNAWNIGSRRRGEHAQDITIVVSSRPHGASLRARETIRRMKQVVCDAKSR